MTHPEIPQIHVSEQAWAEISPLVALVHVTLSADRLFSGRAALEKAGELRRLVVALRERAIPESSIALDDLSNYDAGQVEQGIEADSLADARRTVANLAENRESSSSTTDPSGTAGAASGGS